MIAQGDIGSKVTRIGLVVLASLGAFMMGRYALTRPELALFPLLLLLLPVAIKAPLAGLLIYFPLVTFLPYWIRLPLPLVGSPYALVAIGTTLAALVHLVSSRPRLPRSSLYLFVGLAEIILILGVAFQHGPESFWRFYAFNEGILIFFWVLILVDTPRRARWVLVAVAGTSFLRMLVQFPFAIAYADRPEGVLRIINYRGISNRWLEFVFELSPSFAWMLAMATPLLVALWPVIQEPRQRRRVGLLLALTLVFLMITTWRANLLNLALGFGVVVLLSPRRHQRFYLVLAVIGVAFLGSISWLTPAGGHMVRLWADTVRDISTQGTLSNRWWYLKQGLELFRFSPLLGVGAVTPKSISGLENPILGPDSSPIEVQGHSALAMVAYEYGVIYLVAWLGMLLTAARNMLWLHRHVRDPFDRALVRGLLGGWAVFVAMGILNTGWLSVSMSQVFWASQGLVVLWSDWLQRDANVRLVA